MHIWKVNSNVCFVRYNTGNVQDIMQMCDFKIFKLNATFLDKINL